MTVAMLKTVPCVCCGVPLTVPEWSREDDRVCGKCGAVGMPKTCPKCRED